MKKVKDDGLRREEKDIHQIKEKTSPPSRNLHNSAFCVIFVKENESGREKREKRRSLLAISESQNFFSMSILGVFFWGVGKDEMASQNVRIVEKYMYK